MLARRQEGEACSLAEDYAGAVAAFAGALALPDALRHAPELPDLLTAAEHMLEQQQAARRPISVALRVSLVRRLARASARARALERVCACSR